MSDQYAGDRKQVRRTMLLAISGEGKEERL